MKQKPKKEFIEVEGRTIEEAIKKALKELRLPRGKVEIKVLREPKQGLFGLEGKTNALIRVEKKLS